MVDVAVRPVGGCSSETGCARPCWETDCHPASSWEAGGACLSGQDVGSRLLPVYALGVPDMVNCPSPPPRRPLALPHAQQIRTDVWVAVRVCVCVCVCVVCVIAALLCFLFVGLGVCIFYCLCMCVCVYAAFVCECVYCLCVCLYMCLNVCVLCVCVCICLRVCVCMCVCVCLLT